MDTEPLEQQIATQPAWVRARARIIVVGVGVLMVLTTWAATLIVSARSMYRGVIGGGHSLKERLLQAVTGMLPEIPCGLSDEYKNLCLEARGYADRIHVAMESAKTSNWKIRQDMRNVRRSTHKNLLGVYRSARRCQDIGCMLEKRHSHDVARETERIMGQIVGCNDAASQDILQRTLTAKKAQARQYEQMIVLLPQLRDALQLRITSLKDAAEMLEDICNRPRGPRGGKQLRVP
ncbi:MAG: hypothetical protein M3Y56_00380, partial [Armatimonadota bacterium]|nr:hypothetical protein [Armatimonadota bacterium]